NRQYWLTADKWTGIGSALGRDEEAPISRVLLTEGSGFQFSGNTRMCILCLAMACEVAMKNFIREAGGAKDPVYRFLVDKDRELSVFDFLDSVLTSLTGQEAKSVLTEEISGHTAYFWVRRLFEVRNKVAHEGRAYYLTGDKHTKKTDVSDVN